MKNKIYMKKNFQQTTYRDLPSVNINKQIQYYKDPINWLI
jgi:hypothetical protein